MNQKPIKVELNHRINIQHFKNSNTLEQYKRSINQFTKYLAENGMKKATLDEAKGQIQNFINYLRDEKGLSGASQKARLAGVCAATGTKMSDYRYDSPGIATKGRNNEGRRNETNERVIEFAHMVGIRESEYAKLKGRDLIERDGRTYVVVEKGKGGKYQEQLIAPKDVEAVKEYFIGKNANEKIFTREEMASCEHANLHAIRREHAQQIYTHYKNLTFEEKVKIIKLLEQRILENPKKASKFDPIEFENKLERPIYLRSYRGEYEKQGKEWKLDRFAVTAVSVLHLAHYRTDVVTHHYFI